ncbi:MAG: hypothetical protein FWG42_05885 [Clostridiales bacterium]|nr:hypothetical protein [Clostridiales bacterium]
MDSIKKTGIVAGAVIGGVVGGSISLIGKMAKAKIVDDIGASITSSSILTGALTGELASGTVDAVSGKITKNKAKTSEGTGDLKRCGKQVLNNFTSNVSYVVSSGDEIKDGIVQRDSKKIVESTKKLAKLAVVGAITVGAIKMVDSADSDKE